MHYEIVFCPVQRPKDLKLNRVSLAEKEKLPFQGVRGKYEVIGSQSETVSTVTRVVLGILCLLIVPLFFQSIREKVFEGKETVYYYCSKEIQPLNPPPLNLALDATEELADQVIANMPEEGVCDYVLVQDIMHRFPNMKADFSLRTRSIEMNVVSLDALCGFFRRVVAEGNPEIVGGNRQDVATLADGEQNNAYEIKNAFGLMKKYKILISTDLSYMQVLG